MKIHLFKAIGYFSLNIVLKNALKIAWAMGVKIIRCKVLIVNMIYILSKVYQA